jgi:hypothetical protein
MTTVRANLKLNAYTQYMNFTYNSMCVFNGSILGASPTGLHKFTYLEDDLGSDIESSVVLKLSNFGIENPKRLRRIYISFETTGDLNIYVITDQGIQYGPYLVQANTAKGQQRVGITTDRMSWFEYASIKIENISGCYFALDTIEVYPVIGHNRR